MSKTIESDIEFGDEFQFRDELVSDLIERVGRASVDDRDAKDGFSTRRR